MNKIKQNFLNAGGFAILLIIIAMVFRIIDFSYKSVFALSDSAVCIIALVCGLIYAFSGYVKASAAGYKLFMSLYAVSTLFSLANIYYEIVEHMTSAKMSGGQIIILVVSALISVCVLLLATVKNLGKKKSFYLSYSVILLNIILFIRSLIITPDYIIVTLSNLVIAGVMCIFVNAKYIDKASRGAK